MIDTLLLSDTQQLISRIAKTQNADMLNPPTSHWPESIPSHNRFKRNAQTNLLEIGRAHV